MMESPLPRWSTHSSVRLYGCIPVPEGSRGSACTLFDQFDVSLRVLARQMEHQERLVPHQLGLPLLEDGIPQHLHVPRLFLSREKGQRFSHVIIE